MKAFCLKAPTVRFVNLAIVFAGVFSREWFFNSRKSSFVHSRPRTLILPPPEPETLAVFRIKRAIHAPRIYLRLLRLRDERPRCRRTPEHAEKFAPPHLSNPSHRNGKTIAPWKERERLPEHLVGVTADVGVGSWRDSPRANLVRSTFKTRRLAAPQYPTASCHKETCRTTRKICPTPAQWSTK